MATDDELEHLKQQIQALTERIREYRSLEEDLIAGRVFDKAKRRLSAYMTLGGIALTLSAIVGVKTLTDYAKSLAKDKIDAIAKGEVTSALKAEGERQVAVLIHAQQTELVALAQQQIVRVVTANQPIGQSRTSESSRATDASVDYTDQMPPVRDSGPEASTVGFAVATALQYQIKKTLGKAVTVSPRQIYYYARLKTGTTRTDAGALIRDAIDVLLSTGGVAEAAWPYKAGEFAAQPPPGLDRAEHYLASRAEPIHNVTELKAALQKSGPVVGGITVYQSMLSPDVVKTGRLPTPTANDPIIGGHAVCFVGFDDGTRLLKFQNQWGINWGDKGYGYISYDYADKFLSDAWAIAIK